MTKYEYLTAYCEYDSELNEFGRDGWELVSVITSQGDYGAVYYKCFFKRPLEHIL